MDVGKVVVSLKGEVGEVVEKRDRYSLTKLFILIFKDVKYMSSDTGAPIEFIIFGTPPMNMDDELAHQ